MPARAINNTFSAFEWCCRSYVSIPAEYNHISTSTWGIVHEEHEYHQQEYLTWLPRRRRATILVALVARRHSVCYGSSLLNTAGVEHRLLFVLFNCVVVSCYMRAQMVYCTVWRTHERQKHTKHDREHLTQPSSEHITYTSVLFTRLPYSCTGDNQYISKMLCAKVWCMTMVYDVFGGYK